MVIDSFRLKKDICKVIYAKENYTYIYIGDEN
jgi:hypothetical protein